MSNVTDHISWSDERYGLDLNLMDDHHKGFVHLLSALTVASDGEYATLFPELVRHTHKHFAHEEKLMQDTNFPALEEHISDHRRVLGDLKNMLDRVERGRMMMPREYVRSGMPEWCTQHLATMDSALAAHLKRVLAVQGT